MLTFTSLLAFFKKSTGTEDTTMAATLLPADDATSNRWFLVYRAPYGSVEATVIEVAGDRVRIAYEAGERKVTRWVDSGDLKWVYPAANFTCKRFDVGAFQLATAA